MNYHLHFISAAIRLGITRKIHLYTMDFKHFIGTFHRSGYSTIDPTATTNSAAGKVIAISGGAGGIGYAIARGFCKAGAAIVVLLARRQEALDESAAKLHKEHGTTIWTESLDIRDTAATNSVFGTLRKRLSADCQTSDIDILVTSAAVLDQGENSLDFDAETVRHSFETNVIGNLNLVRAFLEPERPFIPKVPVFGVDLGKKKDTIVVLAPGCSKIILDVSSAALHMKMPGSCLYSSSKLAFTHMMRHLQSEVDRLPGSPIRIHSFHPGAILSPGTRGLGLNEDSYPWDDESLPEGFAVWLASSAAEFLKGRFVWSSWDAGDLIAMKAKFEEDSDFCTVSLKV